MVLWLSSWQMVIFWVQLCLKSQWMLLTDFSRQPQLKCYCQINSQRGLFCQNLFWGGSIHFWLIVKLLSDTSIWVVGFSLHNTLLLKYTFPITLFAFLNNRMWCSVLFLFCFFWQNETEEHAERLQKAAERFRSPVVFSKDSTVRKTQLQSFSQYVENRPGRQK